MPFYKGHKVNNGRKLTEEHKEKISLARIKLKKERGYLNSREARIKMSNAQKHTKNFLGKHHSEKAKQKISEARIGKGMREKSGNWKGGVTKLREKIRKSTQYKKWRSAVFERDGYACQECGKNNCYLEAHHIKSFAHYPKLRFDMNNGKTLCEYCHGLTDNYKSRAQKLQTLEEQYV